MKVLRYGAAILGLTIAGVVAVIQLRWDRTFEAPLTNLKASTDSAAIERGRYLAYGPAHCAGCHTSSAETDRVKAGEPVPMAGGFEFAIPPGTFRTPNLTPDPETGIGRYTDEQLARMIRYGVRHDGRAGLPFMEFQDLADDDVVALLSFLRAQPAVKREVPEHDVNFMGRAILAFLIRPIGPKGTPPARAPRGPTVEHGEYLTRTIAGCHACHTKRNMMDGSFIGPDFAGGTTMVDEKDATRQFVTPNLTPDPRTGRIANWTEDQFVNRIRAGRVFESSHMPWEAFAKMSDDDLRAIYRYLRTIPPIVNDPGPSMQAAKS
jgi:mono/diheme cytochrome c family protein